MPRKLPMKKLRSLGNEPKQLFSLLYGAIPKSQYKKGGTFAAAEQRLDVVVARMFFFRTLQSARQYISHNGIACNQRILNRPSALLKPGDIIQIRDPQKYLGMNLFIQNPVKFPHLEVSIKTFTGIFLFSPQQIYIPK